MGCLQQIGEDLCITEAKNIVPFLYENNELQQQLSEILDTATQIGVDETDSLLYARSQLMQAKNGILAPPLERISIPLRNEFQGVPDPRNLSF
eukprot:TRINITY_DN5343_c0_g1_i1.p3 TRINITY_DN5343_c0_g1~~TRINITY_DN5343_c0_g1_i1.p3  ORF type:complete len:93 (+),score=17.82 TRINITY_DN5343_c0_g1_i1:274-552(+)